MSEPSAIELAELAWEGLMVAREHVLLHGVEALCPMMLIIGKQEDCVVEYSFQDDEQKVARFSAIAEIAIKHQAQALIQVSDNWISTQGAIRPRDAADRTEALVAIVSTPGATDAWVQRYSRSSLGYSFKDPEHVDASVMWRLAEYIWGVVEGTVVS